MQSAKCKIILESLENLRSLEKRIIPILPIFPIKIKTNPPQSFCSAEGTYCKNFIRKTPLHVH